MPTFPWSGSRVLQSLLVGAAVFFTLVPFMDATVFTIFQARDLERAAAAAGGRLFLWGPETTGGGNLPGGFYYWLISLPYRVGFGWPGVWYLMAALDAVAAVVLWNFLRFYGVTAASFGILFYVSSTIRTNMFKLFWNPSFLSVFVMIALISLIRSFAGLRAPRYAWPLAAFMMGLAIQIHLSAAPLILAAIVLQGLGPRMGLDRLPWREWWIGVAALLGGLSPYILWWTAQRAGVTIGEEPPATAGQLSDSFLAVVHNPAGRFVLDADWIAVLKRALIVTWQLVPWPAWIGLIVTGIFSSTMIKRPRLEKAQIVIVICLACSLTSAFLYYYLPFGARYAYVFALSFSVLLGTFAERWFSPSSPFPLGPAVSGLTVAVALLFATRTGISRGDLATYACAFGAMTLLAYLVWREQPTLKTVLPAVAALTAAPFAMFYGSPGRQIVGKVPTVAESVAASEFMYTRTGWSYEEVRRKIHLFMIHRESDLQEIYNTAVRKTRFVPVWAPVDGFLASISEEAPETLADARRHFIDLQGASELQALLKDGGLELVDFANYGRLTIASFIWRDRRHGLEFFHNIGYSLGPSPEDRMLQAYSASAGEIATRVSDSIFLFQWNECEGQPEFGRTGIIVETRSGRLRATVAGQTLSKPSPWTIPYCTQGWVNPFVEIQCDGARSSQVLKLARNIGLNWLEPPVAAYTFIAPFSREFELTCAKIARISAGRESTLTNRNGDLKLSHAKVLSLEMEKD